jgi:hypothetical protein
LKGQPAIEFGWWRNALAAAVRRTPFQGQQVRNMRTRTTAFYPGNFSRGGLGFALLLSICSFLITAMALAPWAAHAAGPRGGGFHGFSGLSRPSGGFQRPSGMQKPGGANRQRPNGTANRSGNANSASKNWNGSATANGNAASAASNNGNVRGNAVNNGTTNSGTVGSGNGNSAYAHNGNTGVVGSGNVNTGNVAVGNNVDVDVNGYGGGYGYPYGSGAAYATGVAVGATSSAVAYGTAYSTIPASACATYVYGSTSYYRCGSTWYQLRYQGSSTTYVVVADPTK